MMKINILGKPSSTGDPGSVILYSKFRDAIGDKVSKSKFDWSGFIWSNLWATLREAFRMNLRSSLSNSLLEESRK